MPRHENRRSRRTPSSSRRRTILVYCGASRTEPAYSDGLRAESRNGSVTIKIRSQGIAPAALVLAAAEFRNRKAGAYDEVWCVVDVDEFDIDAAVVEARRRRVNLAGSNPCFELWLLLHHADCHAYCAGYPDVERRLKKQVPTYDKANLDFTQFASGIGDAVKRAKGLDPTGNDHRRNPSTNAWQLVEKIVYPHGP